MNEDDTRIDEFLDVEPADSAALEKASSFTSILGDTAELRLTNDESKELAAYQRSLTLLGPAGGAVAVCPGNQIEVPVENRCPYAAKCPLLRAQKAPEGKLCPIERNITEERFGAWARRLGFDPMYLSEDARAAVSELTYLDLQEQRSTHILSTGEAMRLSQVNVTDAINVATQNPETGALEQQVLPLTFERVLHINAELLDRVAARRRMILKDWMLTPEQRWKIDKASGKAKGNDIGTQQSARADKLRKLDPDFL